MVYVISKSGKPLMPCENVVARLLFKNGKAKVKKRCPFTIQLMYDSDEHTQEVVLGQDTGSKHIGTACVGNDQVLYQANVELRNDIIDFSYMPRGYKTPKLSNCNRISARRSCLCISQKIIQGRE